MTETRRAVEAHGSSERDRKDFCTFQLGLPLPKVRPWRRMPKHTIREWRSTAQHWDGNAPCRLAVLDGVARFATWHVLRPRPTTPQMAGSPARTPPSLATSCSQDTPGHLAHIFDTRAGISRLVDVDAAGAPWWEVLQTARCSCSSQRQTAQRHHHCSHLSTSCPQRARRGAADPQIRFTRKVVEQRVGP